MENERIGDLCSVAKGANRVVSENVEMVLACCKNRWKRAGEENI